MVGMIVDREEVLGLCLDFSKDQDTPKDIQVDFDSVIKVGFTNLEVHTNQEDTNLEDTNLEGTIQAITVVHVVDIIITVEEGIIDVVIREDIVVAITSLVGSPTEELTSIELEVSLTYFIDIYLIIQLIIILTKLF